MKYVQHVNEVLRHIVAAHPSSILFGQNIDAASCLSGLSRGLGAVNKGLTLNTQNSESTLVGVGFGAMLSGASAVFLMKQTDFLLLGIDQLANTYNILRQRSIKGSFTIVAVCVDSGYEGPQSALNNLDDFCSIANVEGFTCNSRLDTSAIFESQLFAPGFRILSVSQRFLREESLDLPIVASDPTGHFYQYYQGSDVTIACFNFSLPNGLALREHLLQNGAQSSVYSVNAVLDPECEEVLSDASRTGRLIVVNDTKSRNRSSDRFLVRAMREYGIERVVVADRNWGQGCYMPWHDQLEINMDEITQQILA